MLYCTEKREREKKRERERQLDREREREIEKEREREKVSGMQRATYCNAALASPASCLPGETDIDVRL
jgi:hypothetical protein